MKHCNTDTADSHVFSQDKVATASHPTSRLQSTSVFIIHISYKLNKRDFVCHSV